MSNTIAYIKTASGYKPLIQIDGLEHLDFDFSSRLFTLPVVEDVEQPVKLLLQSEHFMAEWTRVDTRHIETLGMNAEAQFSVDKLDDDKYELTLNQPTETHRVILVNLGWHTNAVYGVALTDPAAVLETLYGPGTDHSPVSAEYTLGMMARQPNAPQTILDLHRHWLDEISRSQATDFFGRIESAWEDYEKADGAAERLSNLEDVKEMAENYLADFPQGRERDTVEARLKTASEKLGSI